MSRCQPYVRTINKTINQLFSRFAAQRSFVTLNAVVRHPIFNLAAMQQWHFFLSPPRRLCFHSCLSVCLIKELLKTTDQIFRKFYGMVGHNPGTHRLDYGYNPDRDPDPGIF